MPQHKPGVYAISISLVPQHSNTWDGHLLLNDVVKLDKPNGQVFIFESLPSFVVQI